MASLNGSGVTIFYIYTADGNLVDTLIMQECDEDGLTEEFEWLGKEHQRLNYSTSQRNDGYHIYFTLSFSEYSSDLNDVKIAKLFQHRLNNKRIIIQPRADVSLRKYDVIMNLDNSVKRGIQRGGVDSEGSRLTVLEFKTRNIQHDFNFYDPDNLWVAFDFNDFAKV